MKYNDTEQENGLWNNRCEGLSCYRGNDNVIDNQTSN